MVQRPPDTWEVGAAYESFIGRWSKSVACEFLPWVNAPQHSRWLDVGCGTGQLSRTILELTSPREVVGIDSSEGFLGHARASTPSATFQQANAMQLPFETSAFDATVSGLMLNFVPEPNRAVAEMARVTRAGGTVALYVWDYAQGMQLIRYFFEAAAVVDPTAAEHDEGRRFPLCQPEPLRRLFEQAGLTDVEVRGIDIPTDFVDFDDYWGPFLGGQGAAPSYLMSLDEEHRVAIREQLRRTLPTEPDGKIHLSARAWAIRGQR